MRLRAKRKSVCPVLRWTFSPSVKIFRPKILRYLIQLVGEDEAEDLTQAVMVKVSKGLVFRFSRAPVELRPRDAESQGQPA